MNQPYYDALEDCLSALGQGADLESCLSRYPDLSTELRPILETARLAVAMKDDTVPNVIMQRSRTRILGEAASLRSETAPGRPLRGFPRWALVALALVIVLFLSWRGLVVASAKSIPGDPLYRVKRAAENVSLSIVPNNDTKLNIQAEINERRVGEVITLLRLGRVEPVQFEGILIEQSPGRWVVDGVPVILNNGTVVTGKIENGMVVEVVGQTGPEGWVVADSIWLHSYELIGTVESIGETRWVISGEELQVSKISQIDPAIRSGDRVIVLVEFEHNQVLHAEAILRLLQPSIVDRIEASPGTLSGATPTPSPETPLILKDIEFSGVVQSMSSKEWQIDGTRIVITSDTKIQPSISVGDWVKVHVRISQDGAVLALEIGLEPNTGDQESIDKTAEPAQDGSEDSSIGNGDNSGSSEEIGNGAEDGSGSEGGGTNDGGEEIGNPEGGSSGSGEDSGGESIGGSGDESGGGTGEGSGSGDGGDEKITPGGGDGDGSDSGGNGSDEHIQPTETPGEGDHGGDGSDQKIEPTKEGSHIDRGNALANLFLDEDSTAGITN